MKPWLLVCITSSVFLNCGGFLFYYDAPRCPMDEVIIIVDDWQPNSNTYFAYIDFAKGLVNWMSYGDVTLLTYDSRQHENLTFNVIFKSLDTENVTSQVWQGRVQSTWTEGDLKDVCFQKDTSTNTVIVTIDLSRSLKSLQFLQDLFVANVKVKNRYSRYRSVKPKLKIYEIYTQNQANKGSSKIFTMTPDDWLVQYSQISYRNIEEFQQSFKHFQKDACRYTKVSKSAHTLSMLGNDTCTPWSCFEYFEKSKDKPEVSARINKYTWKLEVFRSKVAYFLGSYTVEVDWGKAMRTCSSKSMSLLTIRSKKEAHYFSRLISLYFEKLMSQYLPDTGEIKVKIGLRRDTESIGQRFSWGKRKDLLFSHWAPGEPNETSGRECADWMFTRNNESDPWIDAGWYTTGCGNPSADVTICQLEVPPTNNANLLTWGKDENSVISATLSKGAFALLAESGQTDWEVNFVISMSLAVSTGFLYKLKHEDNLEIRGPMQSELLHLYQIHKEKLIHELRPLFHPCHARESSKHWSLSGVPFSQVCDGVKDCPTGSDEASCGVNGYIPCLSTEFSCASKQCVPLDARCDLIKDCQDGSDEEDCELSCPHRQCSSGRCLPGSWFYDGQEDCSDGSDENGNPSLNEICVFICNRTKCVTREMLNDSRVDCQGLEGPLDETLGALESINCSQNGNAASINNWAPKCVLVRDMFGEVIGCRNYEHLAGCGSFSCPQNFVKCPGSFCIPLSYVYDGKQDCDEGEDEGKDVELNVTSCFLCNPRGRQCVPLSALCDGKKDCVLGEDELDCGYHCPSGFICLAGAVKASSYNRTGLTLQTLSFLDSRIRYLDMSGVNIPEFFQIYPQGCLNHLLRLRLSRCGIQTIHVNFVIGANSGRSNSTMCEKRPRSYDFSQVRRLDLSHNKLSDIPKCSLLKQMHLLKRLNLSHNRHLSHLHQDSFSGLDSLEVLDLSFTGITWLTRDVFHSLSSLTLLSLENTPLTTANFILPENIEHLNFEQTRVSDISQETFSKIRSLKELRSSTYKLCCPVVLGPNIESHVCHFSGDAISSCTDLVKEAALRVTLWLVSFATLAGNIVTLVYRFIWEKALFQKPYGLFVTNLGLSDLVMGVYLMIIALADIIFKDAYVLYDYKWRTSHACFTAGVLATLSSITSTVFVTLITVDRFLVMQYPYGDVRFTPRTTTAAVAATWLFGLTTASLPLLPFAQDWIVFSNSGMCLGLPLNNKRLPGWQYSATMFVGLNLLLFIFIGIGQFSIYRKLREKGKRTRKNTNPQSKLSQSQRLQEFAVARQLSLIVMTNFICWFPIITMGIMALSGKTIGHEAFRWSAVLILPVNSALNPVLYTLPALKRKWADFRNRQNEGKLSREIESSMAQKEQTRASVRRPDTRKTLLLRSCRSMAAFRRVLAISAIRAQHGMFTVSDLRDLYTRVSNQRATVFL